MGNIVLVCQQCSTQNRIDPARLELAKCGVCKASFILNKQDEKKGSAVRMTGRVKWYSIDREFGFIEQSNAEYYFNRSDLKGNDIPESGCQVEFTPSSNHKGKKAIDVVIVQQPKKVLNIAGMRMFFDRIKTYTVYTDQVTVARPVEVIENAKNWFMKFTNSIHENYETNEVSFNVLKIESRDGTYYFYDNASVRDTFQIIIGKDVTNGYSPDIEEAFKKINLYKPYLDWYKRSHYTYVNHLEAHIHELDQMFGG